MTLASVRRELRPAARAPDCTVLSVEELSRHRREALRRGADEALSVVGQIQHRAIRQRRARARRVVPEFVLAGAAPASAASPAAGARDADSRAAALNAFTPLAPARRRSPKSSASRRDRRARSATLERTPPFFGTSLPSSRVPDAAACCSSAARSCGCVRRHAPQHHAPDLLRTRDRQFGRDQRAQLIAEHIDRAQAQAVEEIADGAGQVGDAKPCCRGIGSAVTRQVGRIDAAVVTQLTQHRREQAAGAAAVMQADNGVRSSKPPPEG